MAKINYSKPALSFDQQLDQLIGRGLDVGDRERALHILKSVSYYRLSAYWYPLLSDKSTHVFKPGVHIDTSFSLYCFDRELRLLVTSELEKIEIAVRAQLIYVMSHSKGCFWYLDHTLFTNPNHFKEKQFPKIKEQYQRSDEEFIKAFQAKYLDDYPPSWMMLEIISFGSLSKIYSSLSVKFEKRQIANHFGLSDKVFENWLHSLVYLRNLCAHHGRMWNRVLSISPLRPLTPKNPWLTDQLVRNDKVYFALSAIRYLLQTVNPKSSFSNKLNALLNKYPNVDIAAMGFPSDWKTERLWK